MALYLSHTNGLTAKYVQLKTDETRGPQASSKALLGLGFVASGLLGIAAYIVYCFSRHVQVFILLTAVGTHFVINNLNLTDEICFGMSVGDIIATCVKQYKAGLSNYMLLLTVPEITAGDISVMAQGMMPPKSAEPEKETTFETLQKAVLPKCILGQNDGVNGHEVHQPISRRLVDRDWYVAAANWLERPDLKLGLKEQLQLYGLYKQAREGRSCFDPTAPQGTEPASEWLKCAKAYQHHQYCNMPRATARSQLPRRLALVDPLFGAAHPELTIPPRMGQLGVLIGLMERRLPESLAALVACIHRRSFATSAIFMVTAIVQAVRFCRNKGSMRNALRFWLCASLCGSASSAYIFALVNGVPATWHIALARIARRQLSCSTYALDNRAAGRIWQYVMAMFYPRVDRSIFLD